MDTHLDRRTFLKSSAVATATAFTLGGTFLQRPARADHPRPLTVTNGPYGPLNGPDDNAVALPANFSSRIIATSTRPVLPSAYLWHIFPDGGATYATDDGGWIYVSNSEVPGGAGGVSAIRFASDGEIVDAYRILSGSSANCAGGPTPWGTWLSCEEFTAGQVWECDPTGEQLAVLRPALGMFSHEAAAVDPVGGHVYLTEDVSDGAFYRFTPATPEDLSSGVLKVASRDPVSGFVDWITVPNPTPVPFVQPATRNQVPSATRFNGGEGAWFDVNKRVVYFATKNDNRIWEYDVSTQIMTVLHDRVAIGNSPLSGVDNVVVSRSGDVYVCEDGGSMEIVIITPNGEIAPFLRVDHSSSEIAGAAFSPDGSRLYFSSQRGFRTGVTFEVTGPFRASA